MKRYLTHDLLSGASFFKGVAQGSKAEKKKFMLS
jgi:hypothetical protein